MNKRNAMRVFLAKYKLQIDVFYVLIFVFVSVSYFIEYAEAENKPMKLFGAIVFGILSLFKIEEVVAQYRRSRKN
jgi:hypothetical protein